MWKSLRNLGICPMKFSVTRAFKQDQKVHMGKMLRLRCIESGVFNSFRNNYFLYWKFDNFSLSHRKCPTILLNSLIYFFERNMPKRFIIWERFVFRCDMMQQCIVNNQKRILVKMKNHQELVVDFILTTIQENLIGTFMLFQKLHNLSVPIGFCHFNWSASKIVWCIWNISKLC